MYHVAIMNKKVGTIERILSGIKKVESRWYVTRRAPYKKIKRGEKIYFKYSGKEVIAKAEVEKVIFTDDLNINKIGEIVKKYSKEIDFINPNYTEWGIGKKYVVLIWLKSAHKVIPFYVNKSGFGLGTGWMCLKEDPMKKV